MNLDRKIQNLQVKVIICMIGNYEPKDHIGCKYEFQKEKYILTYAPTSLIYKIEENTNLTRFICIRIDKEEKNEEIKTIRSGNY